jgi:hypothetical protein
LQVVAKSKVCIVIVAKGGIVAEAGAAYGDFSREIIDNLNPDKFYAIDVLRRK